MALELKEATDLWYHYEEIAMHFNNLTLQYRLQLMGGAGILATVFTYLVGTNNQKDKTWLMFIIPLTLFIIVLAAAILDVFYYDKLLSGAVQELISLEAKYPDLNMSTRIKEVVSGNHMKIIYIVYLLILVPLLVFALIGLYKVVNNKERIKEA